MPQIILQGNWVEQWGFEAGCNVFVECYQNKLIIYKKADLNSMEGVGNKLHCSEKAGIEPGRYSKPIR